MELFEYTHKLFDSAEATHLFHIQCLAFKAHAMQTVDTLEHINVGLHRDNCIETPLGRVVTGGKSTVQWLKKHQVLVYMLCTSWDFVQVITPSQRKPHVNYCF